MQLQILERNLKKLSIVYYLTSGNEGHNSRFTFEHASAVIYQVSYGHYCKLIIYLQLLQEILKYKYRLWRNDCPLEVSKEFVLINGELLISSIICS